MAQPPSSDSAVSTGKKGDSPPIAQMRPGTVGIGQDPGVPGDSKHLKRPSSIQQDSRV